MANILIGGDSWGCIPFHAFYWSYNYWHLDNPEVDLDKLYVDQKSKKCYSVFDSQPDNTGNIFEWLDFQLLSRQHITNNISFWSTQNMRNLQRIQGYLDGYYKIGQPVDLVIWFHTEMVRDWGEEEAKKIQKYGYYEYIDICADYLYRYITLIKQRYPKTKWAIIGGHAPLISNKKHLLDWVEYRVDNWREKITGKECPETHLTLLSSSAKNLLKDVLPLDIREAELQKILTIEKLCSDRTLFYDGVHPNVKPNKELALDIIKHFNL
jgi:hypothetical protein